MKFINYLEKITGVGVYPMVSLLIFTVFFSVLLLWILKADKGYLDTMKNIPFPGGDTE